MAAYITRDFATPGNVLRRVALSRRFHAGDVAQFTATLDDMHHETGMPRPI